VREVSDMDRVPPEAVGQEPGARGSNKSGVGGFVRANLFVWSMVAVVTVVFLAVILYFAL
jgi:hypothetical protein